MALFDDDFIGPRIRQREHAAEPSAPSAFFHFFERSEKRGVVLSVRRALVGEPSRSYARAPAESIHLESALLGKREHARFAARIARFTHCRRFEGWFFVHGLR